MKKATPPKETPKKSMFANEGDLARIARYTAVAVIVVTAIAAIFTSGDAEVAIPISFALVLMGLVLGYWAYKKQ